MTYEFFIAETPAKGAAKGILGKKDWTTVGSFVIDMVGGKKLRRKWLLQTTWLQVEIFPALKEMCSHQTGSSIAGRWEGVAAECFCS